MNTNMNKKKRYLMGSFIATEHDSWSNDVLTTIYKQVDG